MSEKQKNDPNLVIGNMNPVVANAVISPHFEIDPEKGRNTLLLPLNDTNIVDSDVLERLSVEGFTPKPEFHVTIFDDKPGSDVARLIHGLDEARQDDIFNFIRKTTEEGKWNVSPRDDFYLIEKQYEGEDVPRRSVIQMVDCPELNSFYTEIRKLLPQDSKIEIPPAHITLATQGNPRGIGVNKAADIDLYGHKLVTF